jgi:diguanylate cyclase (GGDEF)-like protein
LVSGLQAPRERVDNLKVTSIERGFHPVQRLVRRLSRISPHRQVQLLFLISMVTVAILASAVLGSLGPTQRSLHTSNDGLIPAIEKLDVARESYAATSTALQASISADPSARAAAISELTALNSAGDAAWNAYRRRSAHLPGERSLQRTFEADRKTALASGGAFVTDPEPTTEALAEVTRSASALRVDLTRIKDLYEQRVQHSIRDATKAVEATEREILIVSSAALLLLLIAFGVAIRSARSREEESQVLARAMHDEAERNELETRLQRSLEMAHTEAAIYPLVGRAIAISAPGLSAELLVADSSRAHFRQVATAGGLDGPGCPVMAPTECPAATWGQTQTWPSSTALDACPHLQNRPSGECAAVCVPVSIGGKTVGVVHATSPDLHPPDEQVTARIELIARKVGERSGMLRAFMRSETQAHTDPLTGLMNRRSLELDVQALFEDGHSYVAAYGDLDHFKQLNDLHGHDAGDQALRLFARVLRDTVRPNDIAARYGGEEFVVVLPDCTVADAYAVINRIRERLSLAQMEASGPRFTVSFGIARSRPERTFSETLEAADAALLNAKATGRDRVIVSGAEDQSAGGKSDPVSIDAPTTSSTRS